MITVPGFDFDRLQRQAPPPSEEDYCPKCKEHMLDCECEEDDSE